MPGLFEDLIEEAAPASDTGLFDDLEAPPAASESGLFDDLPAAEVAPAPVVAPTAPVVPAPVAPAPPVAPTYEPWKPGPTMHPMDVVDKNRTESGLVPIVSKDGAAGAGVELAAPKADLLPSAASSIASGGLHTAAGVLDIAGEFVPESGKAFDPKDQAELRRLTALRDSMVKQRQAQKASMRSPSEILKLARDPAAKKRFMEGQWGDIEALSSKIHVLENPPRKEQLAGQMQYAAERTGEYYGADPKAKNFTAQVGRGAGQVFTMIPTLLAGPGAIPATAAQMGAQSYSAAYSGTAEQMRKDGETDEASIHNEASKAGGAAAAHTVPALLIFLGAGKLAAGAAGKLAGEAASPIKRALFGAGGAELANIGTGSVLRAVEGGDWKPTVETLTMDTLFALYHGWGEYRTAAPIARERAFREMQARGFAEKVINNRTAPTSEEWAGLPEQRFTFEGKKEESPSAQIVPKAEDAAFKAELQAIPGVRVVEPTESAIAPELAETLKTAAGHVGPATKEAVAKLTDENIPPKQEDPDWSVTDDSPLPPEAATPAPDLKVETPSEPLPGAVSQPDVAPAAPEPLGPVRSAEAPADPKKFKFRGPRDGFGDDAQSPVAAYLIGSGGILSRSGAQQKSGYDYETNKSQWDDAPEWYDPSHNKVYSRNGVPPNEAAQSLFEAGLIKEPSERAMWEALSAESRTAKSTSEQERVMQAEWETHEKQGEAFQKAASDRSQDPISTDDLAVGDIVKVGTENLVVKSIDPDTLDVTLEDGVKYGVQEIKDGETIWGEIVEKAPEGEWGGAGAPPAGEVPTGGPSFKGSVGIKNIFTEAERSRLGFPGREDSIARSFPELHATASAAFDYNSNAGRVLVNEMAANPRAHSPEEGAILVFEARRRRNALNDAYRQLAEVSSPEARAAAEVNLSHALNDYQQAMSVYELTGSRASEALYVRRMMINEDYSLERMLYEEQALKGEPLTPEEAAAVGKTAEGIEKAQKKQDEIQEKFTLSEAERIKERLVKERNKSTAKKKTLLDFVEEKEKAAIARRQERRGRLQVTVDPGIAHLIDEAIIGTAHLVRGIRRFGEWSAKMLEQFGEEIRPFLKPLFAESKTIERDYAKRTDSPATPLQVIEEAGEITKLDPKLVFDLARAHVNAGKTDLHEIIGGVREELLPFLPDVTDRQVRDVFTNYGKITYPSKAADLTLLRELKHLGRLYSQLEDAMAGIMPLKSGPRLDRASARILALKKEVQVAMRKAGLDQVNPETQLASAHTARVTRLKNELEAIDRQMAAGKRDEKAATVPWTPDEVALRDQVVEMRARLDDALNEPDSKQLASLLDRIEAAKAKIASGDISKPGAKLGPDTAAIASAKTELAALNKEMAAMRKAARLKENPPRTADEKRLADLEQRRDDLALKVAEGDTSTKSGTPTADTPEQAALKQEIEGLNKLLGDMRRAQKPKAPADQGQYNALQKRLADAKAKLAAGDLSTKAVGGKVPTGRVKALREELAAVNKELSDLRTKARNTDAAVLDRAKAASKARQKAIQDRINANDYTPPAKKDKVMDGELLRHQYDEYRLKEDWNNRKQDREWDGKNVWQKSAAIVNDLPNLARILITSADGPPILRQTLTAVSRPVATAKAAWDSLRAMVSEEQRFKFQQEIENRENAALYHASGLRITKPNSNPSATEEQFISTLMRRLPKKSLIGPIGRAAERSFSTYLNRYRADMFDAMYRVYRPKSTELKEMASVINDFTGSASLKGAAEQAAPFMGKWAFAWRKMVADLRVGTLMPVIGKSGTLKSRAYAVEQYARMLGGLSLFLTMASIAGLYVELDTRSAKFGQAFIPSETGDGGTWIDAWSGPLKSLSLASRLISGETKNTKGEINNIREEIMANAGESDGPGFGQATASSLLGGYEAGKLAPAGSIALQILNQRDFKNQKPTVGSVAKAATIPISWQELSPAIEKLGLPKAMALQLWNVVGGGSKTTDTAPE